jgi:hypothetical protein
MLSAEFGKQRAQLRNDKVTLVLDGAMQLDRVWQQIAPDNHRPRAILHGELEQHSI